MNFDSVEAICSQLAQGKKVRETLPFEGRLHIDRPLPFLCVYRRPTKTADAGTDQFVIGEASHLIVSSDAHYKPELSTLIQGIAAALVKKFQAFLIIEIWSAPDRRPQNESQTHPVQPAFRIVTSKVRPPTTTVEALAKALRRIKIQRQAATVEIVDHKRRAPAGLTTLIPSAQARKLTCFIIGLEVEPIYRNPASGETFPFVLRLLHRGLARALRRAFFEFSRSQTSYRPPNYHALGRQALVKAVWSVDRQLAEIGNAFDFLLQVTPVNVEMAWTEFKRNRFQQRPTFYYRPLPVDPALLKRKLYKIAIERIEDPTLAQLFREKRSELDRQLTMLGDRGTRRFLYGSLQIFGGVNTDLRDLAEALLKKISPRSHESSRGKSFNADAFASRALAEIEYYRQFLPSLSPQVQIRHDIAGLMVSRGNLLISHQTKVPASRVEALIQHEVGTHVLTYFNGRAQPFQQLYIGLAGYEELQEGLAVLAEYLVGGLSRPRLRLLAGRVVAANCLVQRASFVETFRELHRVYGFAQRTAFIVTMRIFRGGGLTKDAVYLRGLVEVLKYLKEGGELDPLFVGKIAADHIPIIRELQWRQVLRPTPLYPRYMNAPQTIEKLNRLRNGMTIIDLIERKIS